jgi:DmsE family decaheme c-type cytochrome
MPQKSLTWLAMGPGLFIFILILSHATAVWSTEDNYLDGYTGAGADFKGSDSCLMCHQDYKPENAFTHVSLIDGNPDNPDYGYGCESCHGPGGNHMGNPAGIIQPAKLSVDGITDLCSKCHSELRTFDVRKWYLSEHYMADNSCLTCHSGHSDNPYFLVNKDKLDLCYTCHGEMRSEFSMRSHHPVSEGHLGCEDCHNVHSGEYDFQLKEDGDMLCFTCHPDKEGPFVYNHEISMASGADGCMTCHFAHGGNSDSLLRMPQRLCLECHTDMGPENHFAGTCWSSECHSQIHGSNTHPLFFE